MLAPEQETGGYLLNLYFTIKYKSFNIVYNEVNIVNNAEEALEYIKAIEYEILHEMVVQLRAQNLHL